MATTNNKKNTSLGKPMASGMVYVAPAGTELPTDATTALDAAYKNVGFISEDGVTNGADTDTTTVNDAGGVTVINEISSYAETYQFAMLETAAAALGVRFETANVKVDGDNLTVDHKMPTGESKVYVFEILMTGNRVKRIVVPDGTVTEYGDTQYHAGDAIVYDVTIAANPSDLIGGATSREYIASIVSSTPSEPAQTLKALTVTAEAREGGQTLKVAEAAEGNNLRRYRITDAGKKPTVAYGTACTTSDGWTDFPANGQVTGTEGQVATVVELTNQGAYARGLGEATLPAPTASK